MNNISKKHHYLPVFYLKGFTNDSGRLKIYNVEKKIFVQNGKDFFPTSYFYEENSNTIFSENGDSDFVESSYSDFDNETAKIITKINNSNYTENYNIHDGDMPRLNHFVSLIYWRLPHRKQELKNIVDNNELINLGLSVQNSDGTINQKSSEKLKNHPEFLKSFKFFNSLADSVRGIHCRTPYTIFNRHQELPFICSDNPVIFEKDLPNVFEDDYIFPLSGTRIFVKSNRKEPFDYYLWLLVDVLIYKLAVKYVSCTHTEYIEMLENHFQKYNMTILEFKIEVFKRLK